MKLSCERNNLLSAVQIAASVCTGRTTIPTLQNMMLRADVPEKLELTATDMEVGVQYAISGAKVREKGTLVVPTAKLLSILREASEDALQIEADGALACLTLKDGYFKIRGSDPLDFPDFPKFEGKEAVSVGKKDLLDMVPRTTFATASEATRYALTGILLVLRENEVRMVASDGRRLAYIRRKIDGGPERELQAIVPPKGLEILTKVLADEDEVVELRIQDNVLKMKTSRALVFSRLVEGNFPEYEAVIPKDLDKKAKIGVELLHSAVRRAALMTSDKARAVKFRLTNGGLALSSRAQEIGESKIELSAAYEGEPFEIVFNPEFLIDFLRVVAEDQVIMEFKDRTTAGVIRAGKDYLYLVMPLTVEV